RSRRARADERPSGGDPASSRTQRPAPRIATGRATADGPPRRGTVPGGHGRGSPRHPIGRTRRGRAAAGFDLSRGRGSGPSRPRTAGSRALARRPTDRGTARRLSPARHRGTPRRRAPPALVRRPVASAGASAASAPWGPVPAQDSRGERDEVIHALELVL